MDLKSHDKGARDDLYQQIEELENKQKKAYIRLYEKVGDEIGKDFLKKLDPVEKEADILRE
eukprot:CAMPEP_0176357164 /NCGR_PEP_ID=MMETSP0126-20121128/14566_1 /TAXON_ID=141414 ORGANISM="Strombidinopsis acuminatum, Strain SPMC142" /NCGR_SAMPLE_ID=MMETSP0126 /ASSEMBLY_ACC=CAM_ASM_000229 /LENGTH=60 /DNA_ID=CAMNT_0017710631 /DNA_START=1584 /DNA_END=1766 /DNA_ORIENTATION=+